MPCSPQNLPTISILSSASFFFSFFPSAPVPLCFYNYYDYPLYLYRVISFSSPFFARHLDFIRDELALSGRLKTFDELRKFVDYNYSRKSDLRRCSQGGRSELSVSFIYNIRTRQIETRGDTQLSFLEFMFFIIRCLFRSAFFHSFLVNISATPSLEFYSVIRRRLNYTRIIIEYAGATCRGDNNVRCGSSLSSSLFFISPSTIRYCQEQRAKSEREREI